MMERTYWNWNVLTRGLLGLFLACWLGVAAGAEVGKIVLAVGDARMDGKVLKEGDAIPEGAELSTGADGYLYLKTVDNGFLILRPGSVATVVAYHVDEADPKKSRFRFSLQQGVARSISGDAVGKARKNFRFNTPVAAIGVRGTDFSIYADAQETRVVVLSGGVVVSGFDASCQPQGGGPCEGAGSKELFAGTPGILQIQKGDVPQIVEDKALSPDFVVPPRHDEPAIFGLDGNKVDHKADKPQTVAVTDQESVNLDPLKQSQLQPVIWGRWESISDDLPATVDLSKLENSKDYYVMISNDHYLVWRNKENALVTPTSGGLRFSLADSQAHVEGLFGQAAAKINDGSLSFDFDRALFSTRIDLTAREQNYSLHANGSVMANGVFQSHSLMPGNMDVRGFLSEAQTEISASYVFQSTLEEGVKASGAIFWNKPTP